MFHPTVSRPWVLNYTASGSVAVAMPDRSLDALSFAPLPVLAPGTRVGNYTVLDEWTTEGASRAYTAEHAVFGRKAVLVMPFRRQAADPGQSIAETEARYIQRFERWLRVLSRLDHPNILRLLDCGVVEGTPYAVLEHVEGRTLGEMMEENQEHDLLTLLRLFHVVARVLAYCHERGVVHRDVKRGNIRIDDRGVPFLTGFLIATLFPVPDGLEVRGGTPPLIPPEAWESMRTDDKRPSGSQAYEPPVDVWSFGLTLLVALTGSDPFPQEWRGDGMRAIREAIRSPEPVDLSALRAIAPDPVVAFVSRCVEKDPAARFQNGAEMERALDALIDHLERSAGERGPPAPIVGRNLLLFAEAVGSEGAGRYLEVLVEEHVGAGSFADVYRVRRHSCRSTDELSKIATALALKVLKPEFVREDLVVRRFRREAGFLARVSDPHVVPVRGFGRLGSTLFILLDYLEGPTLHDWMRLHPRSSVQRATAIVTDIARGLDAVHRAAIVHRDLKPDNVILVDDARGAVIADFGLVHGADSSRLTVTGGFCGTPAYASPQQIWGSTPTQVDDLYALGVMFYELLGGARPHRGSSPEALIQSILNDPPEPITNVRGDLDPEIAAVVMRTIDPDPLRRYASAQELLLALKDPACGRDSAPSETTYDARIG
jgi:serine/threonine protein kinase